MGGAQVQPLTPTPLKHFGLLRGGGGAWGSQVTYMPQNDPLVALTILNTHMWGL